MPKINWSKLPSDGSPDELIVQDKEINVPWILVRSTLHDITHLRIQVEGSWKSLGPGAAEFLPDGLPNLPFPVERLTIKDCPAGTLIGKFGGSSSSLEVA